MTKRCEFHGCRIKLGLATTFVCRCSLEVCPKHRLPEDHLCKFDHKELGKSLLTEQLVKVVGDKIDKI